MAHPSAAEINGFFKAKLERKLESTRGLVVAVHLVTGPEVVNIRSVRALQQSIVWTL